jgi:hypothetical protein
MVLETSWKVLETSSAKKKYCEITDVSYAFDSRKTVLVMLSRSFWVYHEA